MLLHGAQELGWPTRSPGYAIIISNDTFDVQPSRAGGEWAEQQAATK
jgi:hypothetical protein